MKLAHQIKRDIEYGKIIDRLKTSFMNGEKYVDIQCSDDMLLLLQKDGFTVDTDGFQPNEGATISLPKH